MGLPLRCTMMQEQVFVAFVWKNTAECGLLRRSQAAKSVLGSRGCLCFLSVPCFFSQSVSLFKEGRSSKDESDFLYSAFVYSIHTSIPNYSFDYGDKNTKTNDEHPNVKAKVIAQTT